MWLAGCYDHLLVDHCWEHWKLPWGCWWWCCIWQVCIISWILWLDMKSWHGGKIEFFPLFSVGWSNSCLLVSLMQVLGIALIISFTLLSCCSASKFRYILCCNSIYTLFRWFWRRSKKEEPLLGGEGNQRKAAYGACDQRDGVVDVEAQGARGL